MINTHTSTQLNTTQHTHNIQLIHKVLLPHKKLVVRSASLLVCMAAGCLLLPIDKTHISNIACQLLATLLLWRHLASYG